MNKRFRLIPRKYETSYSARPYLEMHTTYYIVVIYHRISSRYIVLISHIVWLLPSFYLRHKIDEWNDMWENWIRRRAGCGLAANIVIKGVMEFSHISR